ncbi:peptide chain release factor N(5)-glutamine methyltransferase [Afifella marina]|uniref:Release factor glutamine methyltransferase n=1 Tax=Afifella marina DSM 2698 TaxID=1120955 RepID=A0A1G5NWR2_AFIMA|nr:peptide chain release factor N(5)-glutamine methyltransferase [Afifella marina]SCZ41763.1 release factor glutamine methyltransferase [Afifella marina DSM 2698]
MKQARGTLKAAGIADPGRDARLLLAYACGISAEQLIAAGDAPVTGEEEARFSAFIERRVAREPVVRILGEAEFWGLSFQVGPEVLTPRPETEHVVETALAFLGPERQSEPIVFADLGTGSGAIAVALLRELRQARCVAVDLSAAALNVARKNAARHGVDERFLPFHGDFRDLGQVVAPQNLTFIVSNPPYIESDVVATLMPEVERFDPRMALDGGEDGLAAYRAIAEVAPEFLKPGGALILEIGAGQAESVTALLKENGLSACSETVDLAGIVRVVSARKACDGSVTHAAFACRNAKK